MAAEGGGQLLVDGLLVLQGSQPGRFDDQLLPHSLPAFHLVPKRPLTLDRLLNLHSHLPFALFSLGEFTLQGSQSSKGFFGLCGLSQQCFQFFLAAQSYGRILLRRLLGSGQSGLSLL